MTERFYYICNLIVKIMNKRKTLKDIKVGDTVYCYSVGGEVTKHTVTYRESIDAEYPDNYIRIGYGYFGEKPKSYYDSVQASAKPTATSTTFGMYAATIYFNKEDVRQRIDEDIKRLERRKKSF